MAKRLVGTVALLMLAGSPSAAQEFPPGFVDPAPLLAAVAEEIGEADLRCLSYSGSGGYAGAVGQTFENAVNIDWPRIGSLDNYTRTINWEAGTSVETFDREPGLAPASWKYGLGWRSGTPTQTRTRQTHVTNGEYSWHMDGDGPPVAVHPEIAEVYQLDMWLNPHGFLKAARMPGANPVAFWRWEQIEKGRDGNVVRPEKMHVVAIEMFGKYRVDAAINSRNLIQRLKTTVNIEFSDFVAVFEALGDEARCGRRQASPVSKAGRTEQDDRLRTQPPEVARTEPSAYRERGGTPADGRRQEPHTAARRYNAGERPPARIRNPQKIRATDSAARTRTPIFRSDAEYSDFNRGSASTLSMVSGQALRPSPGRRLRDSWASPVRCVSSSG